MRRAALLLAVTVVTGGVLLWLAGEGGGPQGLPTTGAGGEGRLSLQEVLGGTAVEPGFALATEPRPFDFPRDHGPHPDFRTEWWYFTGNLETPAGRRFGYQLTFFRSALRPGDAVEAAASPWRSRQLYLAHLGVTDPEEATFHAFERFSRGGLGLAGVEASPFRAWLEDWTARAVVPGALFPLRLVAGEAGVGLQLRLERAKPVVLHDEDGLSVKGPGAGNASYYYSYTRLPTRGTLVLGGRSHQVSGSSWMDREWSSGVLAPGLEGWDWFSLQLRDGRELMLYRLRRRDGGSDPASAGTLVAVDGSAVALGADDFRIRTTDHWTSPASGARYPSRWRLAVPDAGLELEVVPVLADQEHRGSFLYWEGAVDAVGRSPAGPLAGRGYVELTGYGPEMARTR